MQGKGSAKNQSWALGFGSQIKNQKGNMPKDNNKLSLLQEGRRDRIRLALINNCY